jgi:hypothetical protein
MGEIGTERREVEFEPLPAETEPAPRRTAAPTPAHPPVPAPVTPEPSRT